MSTSRVYALHKPRGVLCSRAAEGGARTVYMLLPDAYRTWFAVGRLDKDSEGLLLFCEDSRTAQRLMDPGGSVKTYVATVKGFPQEADLEPIRSGGLLLGERRTRPAEVVREGKAPRGGTRLLVTLHEGINRQIRRLLASAGFKVRRLVRTSVGPIALAPLEPGEGRELSAEECAELLLECGNAGR